MPKDPFDRLIDQMPEQQRLLLDRMIEMQLVTRVYFNEKTKRQEVDLAPAGTAFLSTIKKLVPSERSPNRLARLMALAVLADGKLVLAGIEE